MNPRTLSSAEADETSAWSRTQSEPQPPRLFLRRGRGDPASTSGQEEHEPRDEYSLDRKQEKNDKLPDEGSFLPPWRISSVPSVPSMPSMPVVPDNSSLQSSSGSGSGSSSSSSTHQNSNIPAGIPGPKGMHTTDYNIVVIGILIAMIVVLSLNMMVLLYRPLTEFCRRKLGIVDSEQKELMERRYKTIDKWMIRKTIQPHDALCEGIQNYARQPNGASALVAFVNGNGDGNGHDDNNHCNGYRCPNHLNNNNNNDDDDDDDDCHHRHKYQQRPRDPVPVPPLCVAESFETETTRSGSDSSSTSSSTTTTTTSKSLVLNSTDDRSTTSDDDQRSVSVSANNVTFGGPSQSQSASQSQSESRRSLSQSSSQWIGVGCQRLDRMQLLEKIGLAQTPRDVVASEAEATATRAAPGQEHVTCSAESPPSESEHGDNDNDDDDDDDDDDDEETSGPLNGGVCSICIERFEVGDEVSYSPLEGSCNHFFHHDCVREWLLRRKGCPCCREIMLPVDRPECKTNGHDTNPGGGMDNDTDSNIDSNNIDNDNIDNDNASSHRHGEDSSTRSIAGPARSLTATVRWKQLQQQQQQQMQRSKQLQARNEKKARFARQRRSRKYGTYVCVDCGLVHLHPELVVCNTNNKDPCYV